MTLQNVLTTDRSVIADIHKGCHIFHKSKMQEAKDCNLGGCYATGDGVPQDDKEAAK